MFPTPIQFLAYVIFTAVLCEVYYWRAAARAQHALTFGAGYRWAIGSAPETIWIDKARIITHGLFALLLAWLCVSVEQVAVTSTISTAHDCTSSRPVFIAYRYVWAPMFWRDTSFAPPHSPVEAELGTAVPCIVF